MADDGGRRAEASGREVTVRMACAPQEQVTAAVALALEQQTQKLQHDTQLDVSEFDGLLQPIIDTCTKDAISVRPPVPVGAGSLIAVR